MTLREFVIDLQCQGARIEVNLKDRGRRGGAGPTDGKAFMMDDVVATVPTLGEFAERSPYAVVEKEDGFYLTRDGQPVMPVRFPKTPRFYDLKTSDGVSYRALALLHGHDTLATTVSQRCVRWRRPGERCQFCSIEQSLEAGSTVATKTPEQLAEVCEAAVRLDGVTHLVMTTGTTNYRDKGVRYLAKCARAIRAAVNIEIQAQFEPPEDLDDMQMLFNAGVASVGLHIESFDEAVRQRVTPGKAKISIERYFEAYRRAVEIFGPNQVSSFIIVGLGESEESILDGCRRLAEIGVYPFVVPLRPVMGTLFENITPPDTALMTRIYAQVAVINRQHGLSWRKSKAGCERCGACSALPAFEH